MFSRKNRNAFRRPRPNRTLSCLRLEDRLAPAVIAWDKGEHAPRYPSLRGIMAAKKKPFTTRTTAELGVTIPVPLVVREALELPPARPAGRLLTGDSAEATSTLARLLREEAKVI